MSGKLIVYVNEIIKNINEVKEKTGGVKVCAVVKANAYGVGIELCKYIDSHVDYYALANIKEAKQIYNITTKPILVLTPPDKWEYHKGLEKYNRIEYAIDSLDVLKYLIGGGYNLKVHIKVNTGMNRHGVDYCVYKQMIDRLQTQTQVKLVGVFSHFYKNTPRNMNKQYTRFMEYVKHIKQIDANVLCHIANSLGIDYPLDMVRLGKGLYKPQMSHAYRLESYIRSIREINRGESVGYEAKFVAKHKTKVAAVPIGYADGVVRKQGGGNVIINDQYCKIIGNVCMDCFMVDVTKLENVKVGDRVVVWGKINNCCINICQVATKCGTISSELLTKVGSRIKRVYKK